MRCKHALITFKPYRIFSSFLRVCLPQHSFFRGSNEKYLTVCFFVQTCVYFLYNVIEKNTRLESARYPFYTHSRPAETPGRLPSKWILGLGCPRLVFLEMLSIIALSLDLPLRSGDGKPRIIRKTHV